MGRVSMPQGKGSQLHNRREYEKIGKALPDNIDVTKLSENVTLVDRDIRQAYKEIFGEALAQYNSKQKRADRKIEDYYEHIQKSKNGEKLFYEDVVQWGSKEDFENSPETRQKAKEALMGYVSTFEQRNPNLKLVGAYIHMDEASPHLHLDYVPVAHGYSRGLETRNSLDKAMKQMGFQPEKESRKNNATKLWKEGERTYFAELCRGMGLEVEAERKARGSLSVEEYKEARDNMLEEIEKEIDGLQQEVDTLTTRTQEAREGLEAVKEETEGLRAEKTALKAVVEPLRAVQPDVKACEIEVTPVMLRPGEVRVKKTELEAVVEQAKAFVVQAEQLQERSGELDQRERALDDRRAFLAGRELRTQDDWKNLDRERKQLETDKKEFQTAWATLNRRATAVVERERVVGELEAKNQTVHEELNKAQTKIRELTAENTTLRQENSSLKEKITALKNAVVGVYKSLSAVVKAVCMLKYSNTEYRVEGLTRKQGRLIDAIADYGARWAEKAGFKEMAADMSQNVGISEGIQQSIAEREKMEKKKQQQRDEDR